MKFNQTQIDTLAGALESAANNVTKEALPGVFEAVRAIAAELQMLGGQRDFFEACGFHRDGTLIEYKQY